MKIRFLFSSNFQIGPKAVPCEKNQVMDVSFEDAYRLIEGLCAEAVLEDNIEVVGEKLPAIEIVIEERPKRKRKVIDGDR